MSAPIVTLPPVLVAGSGKTDAAGTRELDGAADALNGRDPIARVDIEELERLASHPLGTVQR